MSRGCGVRAPGSSPSDRPVRTPPCRLASSASAWRRERLVPFGDEAMAPRYHPACRTLRVRPLTAAVTASRDHGRGPPALYCERSGYRRRFGQGLGEDDRGRSAPGSHHPRLALAPRFRDRVPVAACARHATPGSAGNPCATLARPWPGPSSPRRSWTTCGRGSSKRRRSWRTSSRRSSTRRSQPPSPSSLGTSDSTTSPPTPARPRSSERRTSRSRTTSVTCSTRSIAL